MAKIGENILLSRHARLEVSGNGLIASYIHTGAKVGVGFGHVFNLGKEEAELTGQLEYYNQSGPAFTFGPQNYGNDFVTGERFRKDLDQDYAAMKAVLVDIGLAK